MARNQYAGKCYECGLDVPAGTGHFERVKGHGWRVKHANVSGHGRVTCAMAAKATHKTVLVFEGQEIELKPI